MPKNQSRKIEFKSLPSEGRCNANPAELQNLSEAIFGYQWSANCLIECQWSASRLVIPNDCNGMPIDYQWNANQQPMECHLTSNGQLITNGMSTDFQCNTNWLPMDNWLPMECHLTKKGQLITNWMSIYWNVNWLPIDNAIPIDYQWTIDNQWNGNWLPMDSWLSIEWQLTTNG